MKRSELKKLIKEELLKEASRQYWWINYTAVDNFGPAKTVYQTKTFNKNILTKYFKAAAKKMKTGDELEYGTLNNGRFEILLLVEKIEKGWIRYDTKGHKWKWDPSRL